MRLVLFVILGVAFVAAAATLWSSRFGRHVRFISRIRIQNDAGHEVRNVRLRLAHDDTDYVIKFPALVPGQGKVIDRRTSDLHAFDLSFDFDGKSVEANAGALATPGETFVVSIRPNGQVEGFYEF
jgi:hypothetical protein